MQLFQSIADHLIDGISISHPDTMLIYVNPAFRTMSGYGDELLTMSFLDMYPPAAHDFVRDGFAQLQADGHWQGIVEQVRRNGTTWFAYLHVVVVDDPAAHDPIWVATFRDVTAQLQTEQRLRQAEQDRIALQEQIIAAQQVALRELSTPIIPIADGVLVMPLIGTLDSRRIHDVMETLLGGISAHRATTVILDITGVQVVDTQVANVLVQASQAVQLLGAQVILTGIRPEVAQTLVSLGVTLTGIITRSTLQSGIAYATTHTHH